jgi:hypothetical protein
MFRATCALALLGMLLTAGAIGCSDQKQETKIPDTPIPLPEKGPMPAGGGGKAAPAAKGPELPTETAQ